MSEKNVASFIVIPFEAPASTDTVLELMTEGNGNKVFLKVTNDLDSKADVTVEVEDKEDGGTYGAISGTSKTIVPGGAEVLAFNTKKYFRVRASGAGAYSELILSTDVRTQHISQLP